jgi:hypothetical protein
MRLLSRWLWAYIFNTRSGFLCETGKMPLIFATWYKFMEMKQCAGLKIFFVRFASLKEGKTLKIKRFLRKLSIPCNLYQSTPFITPTKCTALINIDTEGHLQNVSIHVYQLQEEQNASL